MPSATEAGSNLPLQRGVVLVADVLTAVLAVTGIIATLSHGRAIALACLGLAVVGCALRTVARWRLPDVTVLGTAMARDAWWRRARRLPCTPRMAGTWRDFRWDWESSCLVA